MSEERFIHIRTFSGDHYVMDSGKTDPETGWHHASKFETEEAAADYCTRRNAMIKGVFL